MLNHLNQQQLDVLINPRFQTQCLYDFFLNSRKKEKAIKEIYKIHKKNEDILIEFINLIGAMVLNDDKVLEELKFVVNNIEKKFSISCICNIIPDYIESIGLNDDLLFKNESYDDAFFNKCLNDSDALRKHSESFVKILNSKRTTLSFNENNFDFYLNNYDIFSNPKVSPYVLLEIPYELKEKLLLLEVEKNVIQNHNSNSDILLRVDFLNFLIEKKSELLNKKIQINPRTKDLVSRTYDLFVLDFFYKYTDFDFEKNRSIIINKVLSNYYFSKDDIEKCKDFFENILKPFKYNPTGSNVSFNSNYYDKMYMLYDLKLNIYENSYYINYILNREEYSDYDAHILQSSPVVLKRALLDIKDYSILIEVGKKLEKHKHLKNLILLENSLNEISNDHLNKLLSYNKSTDVFELNPEEVSSYYMKNFKSSKHTEKISFLKELASKHHMKKIMI